MGAQTSISIPGPRKGLRIQPERQFTGISAARGTKAIGTQSRIAISRIVPVANLAIKGRSQTLNSENCVAHANRVAAASAPMEQALRSRLAEWTQFTLFNNL